MQRVRVAVGGQPAKDGGKVAAAGHTTDSQVSTVERGGTLTRVQIPPRARAARTLASSRPAQARLANRGSSPNDCRQRTRAAGAVSRPTTEPQARMKAEEDNHRTQGWRQLSLGRWHWTWRPWRPWDGRHGHDEYARLAQHPRAAICRSRGSAQRRQGDPASSMEETTGPRQRLATAEANSEPTLAGPCGDKHGHQHHWDETALWLVAQYHVWTGRAQAVPRMCMPCQEVGTFTSGSTRGLGGDGGSTSSETHGTYCHVTAGVQGPTASTTRVTCSTRTVCPERARRRTGWRGRRTAYSLP